MDSHDRLMEAAREMQFNFFMGRHGIGKGKKKKAKCCMCNREMESPEWEAGPKYCWKCSDRHEIGREDV